MDKIFFKNFLAMEVTSPTFLLLLVSLQCVVNVKSEGLYENVQKTTITAKIPSLFAGTGKLLLAEGKQRIREPRDSTPSWGSQYDFIVVGAGTAGSTLASRLSENNNFTVLLIEAGTYESVKYDIPLAANFLQLFRKINWAYQTEPSDKYCLGMKNHQCNWPRGKVMGGSSVLNYMIATRGNKKDYDRWAKFGNDGWSYSQVLPYFKKLETIAIPNLINDTKYHNTNGPLYISHPPYHTPLLGAYLDAAQELGYPIVDYDAEQQNGFSQLKTNTKNGFRFSLNKAYLHPAGKRRNLHVTKKSLVSKVLIDPSSKRAYGVEFVKKNRKIVVYAKREVILSAGAIGSPQILMLSGVGPSKHLNELKIPVIKDSPGVGENLMDHISFGGLVFLVNQSVSIISREMLDPRNPYLNDFLLRRNGPLTIPGGCEGIGFIDVFEKEYPGIELLFNAGTFLADESFQLDFNIDDKVWKHYHEKMGHHSWSIYPMLMRPKSKGKLLLRDGEIQSKPKIYPNYFNHPDDMKAMIRGVKECIRISETPAMQKYGSKLFHAPLPGCENLPYKSDDYWACAIRTLPFTIYHYSGTCKMGPRRDPSAVVDPRLKVRNIIKTLIADMHLFSFIFLLVV